MRDYPSDSNGPGQCPSNWFIYIMLLIVEYPINYFVFSKAKNKQKLCKSSYGYVCWEPGPGGDNATKDGALSLRINIGLFNDQYLIIALHISHHCSSRAP